MSAYAFSTENWRRSPEEVRFLIGFSRDVIRRRRDLLDSWGVRVRWAGRRPRLWRSVINELEAAEEHDPRNDVLTLTMCVNYGGRAEIADAVRDIAARAAAGRLDPARIDERTLPAVPGRAGPAGRRPVLRSRRGEQRTSNFLLWQSAYAELVFVHRALAGRGPAGAVAGGRGVRPAGPPLRRGVSTQRADLRDGRPAG